MWRVAAAGLLMTACVVEQPSAPAVQIVTAFDQPMLDVYLDGARAWEAIGFTISTEPSGMEECPQRWYSSGIVDCQLTVTIERSPHVLEQAHTEALSMIAARWMVVDSSVAERLRIAVAHEAGHILLDTPEHTQGGVMGGSSTVVQDVDRELACRTIGLGC